MNLKTVPVLEKSAFMPETLAEILSSCESRSVLFDVPREGVV